MNIRLEVRKSEAENGLTGYFSKVFYESKILRYEYVLSAEQHLKDSYRIKTGPIALFTALTAEEEAATFLYHAFVHKGYDLPDLKRLRAHQDKVRVVLWAKALIEHCIAIADAIDPQGAFRVIYSEDKPIIAYHFCLAGHRGLVENILECIVSQEGEMENPARQIVDAALQPTISSWGSIEKAVEGIANQRNLCLYGNPSEKPCISESGGWEVADYNCASLIMLGVMIHQTETRSENVQLIAGLAAEMVGLHRKAPPYTRPR
jgi:hypothetical protein